MIGLLRELSYRLPEGPRRALMVRRRAKYWRRAGIVFIHVPKAAGTSINEALYGRFMGHARASDVKRWAPRAVRALPSFSVTRNPWDRLVSAYRFASRGQGLGETYRAGMWQASRYRTPEFATFERFVEEWLAPRDVTRLDGVFKPQWLFLCDRSKRLLVDHAGRLEDMEPTLDFIARHAGSRPAPARANRSGESVDYRSFYTPPLINAVAEIYRDDIELFGYDF
ncbi:MAG: sulfotransferase family protein [Pseudomonadota bacterium]|nr:sulfotransferase family protein [Pseudomonadota bacterium]